MQEPSGIIEVAERKIARFQPAQIAQHFGLGVMGVENRMSEEIGLYDLRFAICDPATIAPEARRRDFRRRFAADLDLRSCRFVERNADRVSAELAQVAFQLCAARLRICVAASCPEIDADRVEEIFVSDLEAELAQADRASRHVRSMNAFGDRAQAVRSVINRIHRGDDGEKHLRRADVARRFVAADVLLARLQREAISRPSGGIVRNADQSSRHVAFVLIARRKIGGVRSAEAERNAETLRAADGDIGAEFARRLQQGERENIGRDDDERAGVVRRLDESVRNRKSRRRSPDIARARRKPCRRT